MEDKDNSKGLCRHSSPSLSLSLASVLQALPFHKRRHLLISCKEKMPSSHLSCKQGEFKFYKSYNRIFLDAFLELKYSLLLSAWSHAWRWNMGVQGSKSSLNNTVFLFERGSKLTLQFSSCSEQSLISKTCKLHKDHGYNSEASTKHSCPITW